MWRRWAAGLMVMCLGASVMALPQREQDSTPSSETGAAMNDEPEFEVGRVELTDGTEFKYRLLTPPEDAEQPEGGWPLIVFLHGAGERGDDNEAQLRHFPERMATEEYRERFPCYVLAGQCPTGEKWADFSWDRVEKQSGIKTSLDREPTKPMQGVIAAVKKVVAENAIDPQRVTLTGLSMGGFGSWDLAARKPDWFAAVAPICGGGDILVVDRYKGLPFWVWHDIEDPVVPIILSRRMVEASEAAGIEMRFTETTGHGHASWVPAYDADNLPAWLLEQRRKVAGDELARLRQNNDQKDSSDQ